MANGDEYIITHGPWKGWTHRSVDLPSSDADADCVPFNTISRILVGYHELTVEGLPGDYALKEQGGIDVKGPHPIIVGGTGILLAGDGSEGIRTISKNKALQVSRGAVATVKGEICYRYEQVIE